MKDIVVLVTIEKKIEIAEMFNIRETVKKFVVHQYRRVFCIHNKS